MHPFLVHYPLAFILASHTLDVLLNIPAATSALSTLAAPTALAQTGYLALSTGIIASVPAIVAGGLQFRALAARGVYESDGRTVRMPVKMAFVHAIMCDVAVLASAYVWWCKRATGGTDLPAPWMAFSGAAIGAFFWVASRIGHVLTYNFGVGLSLFASKKKEA